MPDSVVHENPALHDNDTNTLLAMRRTRMSIDRTLMAWIRTSLSMIGFGFTLAKVFRSLAQQNVFVRGPAGTVWSAEAIGIALLSLGVLALIAAIFSHRHDMKQLVSTGLKPQFSLAVGVASVLALVGCLGLMSISSQY